MLKYLILCGIDAVIISGLLIKYFALRKRLISLNRRINILEKTKHFTEEQALYASEKQAEALQDTMSIEVKMLILGNRADLLQHCYECPLFREKVRVDTLRQTEARKQ